MTTRKNIAGVRSWIIAVGMASACAGLGVQVAAAASPDLPSMAVSYSDINLNTDAGAKALYQRIRSAAERVCGPRTRAIGDLARFKSCVATATSDAVATLASPALTAVYDAHHGKRSTAQLANSQPR
jgi:UrcA family protein